MNIAIYYCTCTLHSYVYPISYSVICHAGGCFLFEQHIYLDLLGKTGFLHATCQENDVFFLLLFWPWYKHSAVEHDFCRIRIAGN